LAAPARRALLAPRAATPACGHRAGEGSPPWSPVTVMVSGSVTAASDAGRARARRGARYGDAITASLIWNGLSSPSARLVREGRGGVSGAREQCVSARGVEQTSSPAVTAAATRSPRVALRWGSSCGVDQTRRPVVDRATATLIYKGRNRSSCMREKLPHTVDAPLAGRQRLDGDRARCGGWPARLVILPGRPGRRSAGQSGGRGHRGTGPPMMAAALLEEATVLRPWPPPATPGAGVKGRAQREREPERRRNRSGGSQRPLKPAVGRGTCRAGSRCHAIISAHTNPASSRAMAATTVLVESLRAASVLNRRHRRCWAAHARAHTSGSMPSWRRFIATDRCGP